MAKNHPAAYRRRRASPLEKQPTESGGPELRALMVAEGRELYRPLKEQITLRLDKDLLSWFKRKGAGYQTRINEALREYVLSHLSEEDA